MSRALLSRFHPWRKSTPLWHSPHDKSTLKPRKVFASILGRLLTRSPVSGSSLWRPNNMTYFGTNLMTLACERQWQDLDRCCSQVRPLPARQPPAQLPVSAIKSHLSFPTKHFSSSCRDVGLQCRVVVVGGRVWICLSRKSLMFKWLIPTQWCITS